MSWSYLKTTRSEDVKFTVFSLCMCCTYVLIRNEGVVANDKYNVYILSILYHFRRGEAIPYGKVIESASSQSSDTDSSPYVSSLRSARGDKDNLLKTAGSRSVSPGSSVNVPTRKLPMVSSMLLVVLPVGGAKEGLEYPVWEQPGVVKIIQWRLLALDLCILEAQWKCPQKAAHGKLLSRS